MAIAMRRLSVLLTSLNGATVRAQTHKLDRAGAKAVAENTLLTEQSAARSARFPISRIPHCVTKWAWPLRGQFFRTQQDPDITGSTRRTCPTPRGAVSRPLGKMNRFWFASLPEPPSVVNCTVRRGGRVVDGSGLENRCTDNSVRCNRLKMKGRLAVLSGRIPEL